MSHSWSSAPHWKCGIPARVSRVRIPSSPPQKSNAQFGRLIFSVGVAVWTKRLQSVIAEFGARGVKTSPFAKFVLSGEFQPALNHMGLGLQISAWQLIDFFCNQNPKNIAHTLWAILCIFV